MNTKDLQRQLKKIIKTGAGYEREYMPTLTETHKLLKKINSGSKTSKSYFRLGELMLELEDSYMAEEAFREAIKIDPHDHFSTLYLGLVLEQMGRLDEAVQMYLNVNRLAPENVDVVERILKITNEANNITSLLHLCKHFLQLGVEYPSVYYYLSTVLNSAGEYKKALKYAEVAIQLEPENSMFLKHVLNLLFANQEFEKVLEYEQQVIEGTEYSITLKVIIPKAYAELDDMESARDIFAKLARATKLLNNHKRWELLNELGLFFANYYF